jgi:hypothetical protein
MSESHSRPPECALEVQARRERCTRAAIARMLAYGVQYGRCTEQQVRNDGRGDLLDFGRAQISGSTEREEQP